MPAPKRQAERRWFDICCVGAERVLAYTRDLDILAVANSVSKVQDMGGRNGEVGQTARRKSPQVGNGGRTETARAQKSKPEKACRGAVRRRMDKHGEAHEARQRLLSPPAEV